MNDKEIYDMKLHDTINVVDSSLFGQCTRVPGGWIYNFFDKGHGIQSCTFVPFNNEFQDKSVGCEHNWIHSGTALGKFCDKCGDLFQSKSRV